MGDNTGADGEQHCPARVSSGALARVWLAFEWCVLLLLDPPSVEQALPWMVYLGAPAFVLLFTLSHAQKRGPQNSARVIFPRRGALHSGVWPLLSASLFLSRTMQRQLPPSHYYFHHATTLWCRQHPLRARSGLWVNYVIICWCGKCVYCWCYGEVRHRHTLPSCVWLICIHLALISWKEVHFCRRSKPVYTFTCVNEVNWSELMLSDAGSLCNNAAD